jgi:hypothetical protein
MFVAKYVRLSGCTLVVLALLFPPAAAQRQAGDTRGMVPIRLLEGRPKGKAKRTVPRYRRKGSALPAGGSEHSEIGVTIWRLRPSTPNDPPATREILLKTKTDDPSQWTPVRLAGDPALRFGQRFRLSIETPLDAYLYVIDRSRYAGGAAHDPHLIFPTTSIRGGDNRVSAGRAIEIPPERENSYFEIGGDAGLEAEEVIVLVVSKPLDLPIGADPLELTDEQIAGWERQWGAPVESLEMVGGVGRVVTPAEKAAWTNEGQLLTQGDPLPQTVYRIAARPNDPLFLRVVIRVQT